jgi:hypothetical protein
MPFVAEDATAGIFFQAGIIAFCGARRKDGIGGAAGGCGAPAARDACAKSIKRFREKISGLSGESSQKTITEKQNHPSEDKAPDFIGDSTYGLKPVPFKSRRPSKFIIDPAR